MDAALTLCVTPAEAGVPAGEERWRFFRPEIPASAGMTR
ncbi:MAG: hypothetical protein JWO81_2692 [Alphaproteobacteria bacterium]|nr:hypothetical protein [Alphaproteobacteria bacterium]